MPHTSPAPARATTSLPVCAHPAPTGRHTMAQRGMVTAEYAVGILAAVALALVMLKVFSDNSVFTALLHYVTALIGHLSSFIG